MQKSTEKLDKSRTVVLLLTYRRSSNLETIVGNCFAAGYTQMHIVVDQPKEDDFQAIRDNNEVRSTLKRLSLMHNLRITFSLNTQNAGCAVSLIKGCDWVFDQDFDNVVVFEDDCIPTIAFFRFFESKLGFLNAEKDVWLLCGTQLVPSSVVNSRTIVSRYPLSWGWATTSSKWMEIREAFSDRSGLWLRDLCSINPEDAFWSAGKRRALLGYTDVWDTAMVSLMLERRKFALLPPIHLVSNVGSDSIATNVSLDSAWTRHAIEPIFLPSGEPVFDYSVDEWIKQNIYQIRPRHLLSTKITLGLDFLFNNTRKRFNGPLNQRLIEYVRTSN